MYPLVHIYVMQTNLKKEGIEMKLKAKLGNQLCKSTLLETST